jgi:type II secretory pathway pseudopilin PulG
MPIFDDILSQPAVLISIGLAFLFIVAAVVLALLPRIKASRARAQRRKAAAQAAQEAARLEAEAIAETTAATRKGGKRRAAAPAEADEVVVQPTKAAKAQAPAATPSSPVTTAAAPAPAAAKAPAAPLVSAGSTTTDTKEDEVSPKMQDLLSSVFSDEDNSERQAILLKGIAPISADELLTLSKIVAAQLRGEQPSNIVRVKENDLS